MPVLAVGTVNSLTQWESDSKGHAELFMPVAVVMKGSEGQCTTMNCNG